MQNDPIRKFQQWFKAAQRAGGPLPEAMALATADERGHPSVRYVLLKQADAKGFAFFTDARSRKGSELKKNPHAAVVFYWDSLGRQVRVEGRVEEVSAEEVDAYWETRPRQSRLGARASHQSFPIETYEDLRTQWKIQIQAHKGKSIPRPPYWTGFRIVPDAIEFWRRKPFRLHQRELFRRGPRGWKTLLLQP